MTDRSILFVGAMNFDARSDPQNTQIGLFIERPETARPAVKLFEVLKPQGTCPLRLVRDGKGHLEWMSEEGGRRTVLTEEPNSADGDRILLGLPALLPPDRLL